MRKGGNPRRTLVLTLIMTMVLALFPVLEASAAPPGYNENDFNKLQAFLNQASAEAGKTNGQALNPAYDPDDPATWTDVTWNAAAEKRVTGINWWNHNLASGLDLSGCTELEDLSCNNNQLTSLNLSGCAALEELYCDHNQLTSLGLSGCAVLAYLYCNNNQLEGLDVSDLEPLFELKCGDNELAELDLSLCTALASLDCQGNQLAELDARACTLSLINAGNNPLMLLAVQMDGALIELSANGHGTVGLEYNLGTRQAVATPDATFNLINWTDDDGGAEVSTDTTFNLATGTDYDLTANFASDTDANDDGYRDHDFDALQAFLNLPSAEAGKTNGEALNPAYDPDDPNTWSLVEWSADAEKRVTGLDWGGSGFAGGLDLSGCAALEELGCEDNELSSLDVSGCTALEYLYCQRNQLEELDVSDLTALIQLCCGENELEDLDISHCTALEQLECRGNPLEELNVSVRPGLQYLDCSSIQLTSLDASDLEDLRELRCNDNNLENLDVSNCTLLVILECSGNQLEVLDTSASTLTCLDARNNPLTLLTAQMASARVELAADGHGTVGLDYNLGTRQVIATPCNPVAFINWTDDDGGGIEISTDTTLNLVEDTDYDLTAHFQYSVTFDKNGGSTGADPSVIAVDPGDTIAAPAVAPTRSGYTFAGWYREAAGVNAWTFDTDTVTANTTLYAKWTSNGSSGGSSHGGGGGGGIPPAPAAPSDVHPGLEIVKTPDDIKLNESLKKTGEAKLELSADADPKAVISGEVVGQLQQSNLTLTLTNQEVAVEFGPAILGGLKLQDQPGSTLELGVRIITPAEEEQLLAAARLGASTGIFEIGGKIVDLTAQITSGNGASSKVASFSEPLAVTIDLSDLNLNEEQIKELCGMRMEKDAAGNTTMVKLGGTYDPVNKSFTFSTDRFSPYSVMQVKNLVTISITLDNPLTSVNGVDKRIDVPPTIINDRTMVPLRFIGEALGAKVDWQEETRMVTIILNDKVVSMVIDRPTPGMDSPPRIVQGRTLVPIRFISESLGANVMWYPSSRTVSIVK